MNKLNYIVIRVTFLVKLVYTCNYKTK